MFATVEKYSGPAKVLLGLIALTFIGFGVSTVAAPGSDYIVKVGEQKVSQNDVQQALHDMQASGGAAADSQAVFNSLLQRAYLTEGAQQMGIGVSQEQLKQVIVDDPTFHENGKFSQQKFNEYLKMRNMTEDQLVNDIRRQFELQNLLNLAQAGALVSDAQVKQLVNIMFAERVVRTVAFDPRVYAEQVKPDDTALHRYYEKNKDDYTLPQAVKFQYIALSAKDLAEKQTVTEEELKKAFEQASKSAEPQREVAHIMLAVTEGADKAKVKAEAEKVLAQVKAKPDSFAALAKQYSQDTETAANGGSLGLLSKNSGLPAAFETAAFQLEKGAVSELVETPSGFHIIRVLNIQGAPSFEQDKARLEVELKQQKAQQALVKMRETLAEEAFANPNSLEAVAKKLNLKLETENNWISKQVAEENKMPAELVEALFGDEVLKKKHNSEPITVGDAVWVVRATEVREQKLEPFSAVKELVKMAYIVEQATQTAKNKANQALQDLKGNRKVDLVWSPVETLNAEQARMRMPPQAFDAMIKARPANGKPAYVLLEGLPVPVLMEVQSVKLPEQAEQQMAMMRQVLLQRESGNMLDYLTAYLQQTIKQTQGAQKLDTASES